MRKRHETAARGDSALEADRSRVRRWSLAGCGASLLWLVLHAVAPGFLPEVAWIPGAITLTLGSWAARRTARSGGLVPAGRRFWNHIALATLLVIPGSCLLNGINTHVLPPAVPVLVAAVTPIAAALLLVIWALLRLPSTHRAPGEALRLGLDAATVMVVAATVLWEFQIRPMIGSDPQLRTVIGPLVLCVICLGAVLAVVKLVLAGTDAVASRSLQALGLLVLIGALSSAVTRLLENDDRWLGVGPLVSTVEGALVAWAALRSPEPSAGSRGRRRRFSFLPYAAVAAIDVLLITTLTGRVSASVVIGSIVVTALVVGRQILAFLDNGRLIDSLHEHRRMLEYQATHDPLTGLANRALFYDSVSAACAATPDAAPPAVLLIDLDGFKPINDTLGHAAGDALLIEVARRLERAVRQDDRVARLGGDEFAVLLPGADDARATGIADRILGALQEPVRTHGATVRVGASIGIAAYTDGDDAESLTRHADLAMYRAKAAGKNRYATHGAEGDPLAALAVP
ncbi:GGDEF domain-containing protein [Couchioplanes azureus]|uniref:GGDEF domain-containing protein n=1 Tax=Couchioplanes caeruleus TaxID=56438 RepID=UPI001670298A|nr:GGDEF domain-containing protein [Couchioplanes caeruleus]GGQ84945.1 hypothetical protein GCM10010166_63990 [Couchioplanes caeruleus subsp. azureus]